MNKKPVYYWQTDQRWKSKRYPCNGGTMSIGGGGCGPTSAAMLIETLTGKQCLPTETMEWACKHGYVTANQGTDYAYFKPQFNQYGIACEMLTWSVCLSAGSWVRDEVIRRLKEGYYFIALMKKGLWTSGGHYIVVWWADDKIRINDPASTRDERLNGDPDTFFSQAKYFWWVDARAYNNARPGGDEEEEDVKRYNTIAEISDGAPWATETIAKLIEKGIIKGSGQKDTQGRPADMNLSEDMIRMLVWNDRAGLYGE